MDLDGLTAIVTGGASGVGYSIARALVEAGADVVIADVRADVEERAAELAAGGRNVIGVPCDVARPDDVVRVVERAAQLPGRLGILINNAAVMRTSGPFDDWEKALGDFDAVLDVNVRGVFLFGRAVAPLMVSAGGGHIVNMSTDHVHTCGWPVPVSHEDARDCPWSDQVRPPGVNGMDVYDASKWALNGLTQAWAKALRPHGVRVNNICLGATDSGMLRAFSGYSSTPPPADVLASWMDPADVARVVVELIGEGPTGRSGDNVGLWRGHPTVLPPPSEVLDVSVER